MTIGLILLAAVAIFLFFGGSETFFARLGLSSRLTFFIVIALVLGAVIPQINFVGALVVNLGGFLVPIALMAVLIIRSESGEERMRALLSITSVAAVCICVRLLIPSSNIGLAVTISVVTGFVGAVVSCITSHSRTSALAGVLGGIVIGDIITSVIYRFFIDGSVIELGTAGAFDAIIIGVVFTIIIGELLSFIKVRASSRHSVASSDIEAASDLAEQKQEAPTFHFNEEDYEDYFNDDID